MIKGKSESIYFKDVEGKVYMSDGERDTDELGTMKENHRGQRNYGWKGVR